MYDMYFVQYIVNTLIIVQNPHITKSIPKTAKAKPTQPRSPPPPNSLPSFSATNPLLKVWLKSVRRAFSASENRWLSYVFIFCMYMYVQVRYVNYPVKSNKKEKPHLKGKKKKNSKQHASLEKKKNIKFSPQPNQIKSYGYLCILCKYNTNPGRSQPKEEQAPLLVPCRILKDESKHIRANTPTYTLMKPHSGNINSAAAT